MSHATPLLDLTGVIAGYGGQKVLRGISITVPDGGLVTLIGPNGHGKTTLLRCISGIIQPDSGEVRLAGERIDGLRVDEIVARGVVHIPQGDMIFPDMSVLDNLLMGAHLPQARAKARSQLDAVYNLLPRLQERRSQVASTLSGGERRMLAIGRGLMADGRIMLIDEPSLGLAPVVIEQIYGVIEDLKRSGRTILLVEENASRASDLSDRIHLLDEGQIVWNGSGAELAERDDLLTTYLGG